MADIPAKYWHRLEDGRIQCDLCPRYCKLREGQRGFCFVRARQGGRMMLTTFGRSSGYCVDPIEKKPLYHFFPGTPVLSFGTAGCNLSCRFCQNWDISTSRKIDTLSDEADPGLIARAAKRLGCRSVAFTYNDPVIFHEYAVETAKACRSLGVHTVAVTAGYVSPEPRVDFFKHMDAANVDLKSFTDGFYAQHCGARLEPVLETLQYLRHHTRVWLELTTLLIPGENDAPGEIDKMTTWVLKHLGPDVPMHFTAFHPDWKMLDKTRTPAATLRRARAIAVKNGVRHAYTGNVHDPEGSRTLCRHCGEILISRTGYGITDWRLSGGVCRVCQTPCAGQLDHSPGDWGSRRMPVRLRDFQ